MKQYQIYCDDYQEGMWFRELSPRLSGAELTEIPSYKKAAGLGLSGVLKYDRPDIILQDGKRAILVLERTSEVPSGHNVGQRYGRLLAAAEERVPVVYFGPYAAYKHGGNTAGPRYMNLRLFYSLRNVSEMFDTAVTTINWPVNQDFEVLRTPEKDQRVRKYLKLFFSYYEAHGMDGLTEYIKNSSFQEEQYREQARFAKHMVRSPEQYDIPPKSVELLAWRDFCRDAGISVERPRAEEPAVLYHIGMRHIRSDPYAGMAGLYKYLYCRNDAPLILHFARIKQKEWSELQPESKTYRMYKAFADVIWFQDGVIPKSKL